MVCYGISGVVNTKFYTHSIKVCHFASANMKGRTYVRTYSVRTIFSKPKFLESIDYHIFLPTVLRCTRFAHARAPLKITLVKFTYPMRKTGPLPLRPLILSYFQLTFSKHKLLLFFQGMQKINFSGGEPFIHKRGDFVGELVRYCKTELGIQSVTIVCNGSLVTERWFKSYGTQAVVFV